MYTHTHVCPICPLIAVSLLAACTNAQPVSETHILLPTDTAENHIFGEEVDLHNGIAIVGGKGLPNLAIPVIASAYLFDTSTGAQLAKLPLPPIDGPDQYLLGVAIGANRAMVATRNWTSTPIYNPRIWLFDTTDPANPVFMQYIQPADAIFGDDFGHTIDIEGDITIVGAPYNRVGGALVGAAYIFNTTTGAQLGKIITSDGENVDLFGWSIDLHGDIVIIGAYLDDDSAPGGGAAYFFDISDPANPVELAKVFSPAGNENDYFGYEVAISGITAVVGSIFDDEITHAAGAAYIYDISTPTSPVLLKKLFAPDADSDDNFGWSVAMEGDTLLVGARTDDHAFPGGGSAYLFDMTDPANPVEVAKFIPSDAGQSDTFGWAAELENGVAIIGASQADSPLLNAGAAYIFDATLPSPDCLPDVNGDGMVTPTDFTAWINAFNNNLPECDQNGDGACTPTDFTAWINNFNAGC